MRGHLVVHGESTSSIMVTLMGNDRNSSPEEQKKTKAKSYGFFLVALTVTCLLVLPIQYELPEAMKGCIKFSNIATQSTQYNIQHKAKCR